MRRAIARACLCARLKHWRRATKSTPCLIKKASRCAADRTSKTKTFFIFHFCKTQRSYEKIMCIYLLFLGSVVKIALSEAAIGGVLYKKVVLKFAKFTGKYKCQSLFLNKFAGAARCLLIVLT